MNRERYRRERLGAPQQETDQVANMLVRESQLREVTGYKDRGRLATSLERQGIQFFRGRSGTIWTTLDELNRALRPDALGAQVDIDFDFD